jgi:outer membrane biosynthesis protein TonB
MNSRLITVIAALGCVLLASCYPYDESKDKKPTRRHAPQTVTSPDQQKIQEQRNQAKATETTVPVEEPKTETVTPPVAPPTTPKTTSAPTKTPEPPKPQLEEKRVEHPVANKVPGKEGFVFSPYNNKVVDVRDIPSGTLVQDPTYTGAGKGYFRVP